MRTLTDPCGRACALCAKQFPPAGESPYYCPFTKEYLCLACGGQEDATRRQFAKRFCYPHNLLFLDRAVIDNVL